RFCDVERTCCERLDVAITRIRQPVTRIETVDGRYRYAKPGNRASRTGCDPEPLESGYLLAADGGTGEASQHLGGGALGALQLQRATLDFPGGPQRGAGGIRAHAELSGPRQCRLAAGCPRIDDLGSQA